MPDDWSWTPDETGLDDDETLPDAFYEALESSADDDATPCPHGGAAGCERSCTGALLDDAGEEEAC